MDAAVVAEERRRRREISERGFSAFHERKKTQKNL
jgi:hypothetical protein